MEVSFMLSNGWHDVTEWPTKSGECFIISVFNTENPENNPELVVRNGDTIVEIDYYDAEKCDWDRNPFEQFQNGWRIVAWKEVEYPMLPKEYAHAVLFEDLPKRESFAEEKNQ